MTGALSSLEGQRLPQAQQGGSGDVASRSPGRARWKSARQEVGGSLQGRLTLVPCLAPRVTGWPKVRCCRAGTGGISPVPAHAAVCLGRARPASSGPWEPVLKPLGSGDTRGTGVSQRYTQGSRPLSLHRAAGPASALCAPAAGAGGCVPRPPAPSLLPPKGGVGGRGSKASPPGTLPGRPPCALRLGTCSGRFPDTALPTSA